MSAPLRTLIIEDSEDDAALVTRALERGGFIVHAARIDTPGALLSALDEGAWDLVLADHSMPRFSAPEALTILKRRGLDLPFIIVSGGITDEIAVMAMHAGAHDYVMKEHLARLVPAVERELREAAIRREQRKEHDLAMRLLRILDASVNEIYVFEAASLRFVQANQRAVQNLGYSLPEIERLTPVDLAPEYDLARFTQALAPLHTGIQEQLVINTVYQRKDGSVYPVALRLQLSRSEEPPLYFAVVTDLTEQQHAERALWSSQEAERRRIARELHDALMQDFGATVESLLLVRARTADPTTATELSRATTSIQRALQELRRIVFNLHPTAPAPAPAPPPSGQPLDERVRADG